jgi:hypothetical protein
MHSTHLSEKAQPTKRVIAVQHADGTQDVDQGWLALPVNWRVHLLRDGCQLSLAPSDALLAPQTWPHHPFRRCGMKSTVSGLHHSDEQPGRGEVQ